MHVQYNYFVEIQIACYTTVYYKEGICNICYTYYFKFLKAWQHWTRPVVWYILSDLKMGYLWYFYIICKYHVHFINYRLSKCFEGFCI